MPIEIREINEKKDLENSLEVIRVSFQTVARELNLTPQNCPSHSSFITFEKLDDLKKKARLFGLFADDKQISFVAIEKAGDRLYYLDKLAVLPEQRHRGYGRKLVEYVLSEVKKAGGSRVSLGMIDNYTVLKEWYKSLGFMETGTKKFDHLPFTVCFMDRDLSGQ